MSLAPGTRLGPYEVVAPIGAGGMGEVYRARDTRLGRDVAAKVLPSEVATDAERRARFEREARAVAALDHPHICAIYDVGEASGTHYLVMPLLDGQTLEARLAKGAVPLDQALTIAGQIADALDKAHRQGIVHRDLKPANVMLTKTGAKLLDFGLAKLRAPGSPVLLSATGTAATAATGTAEGTILGTLHYMAPEQVEGKDADARSDIWALGAVLYEMGTGTRPFTGDTAASVIGAILKDTPPPLSTRQRLSPPALDHVVASCLAKDPDARWQNAGDVARQLAWLSTAPPADARPTAEGSAPPRRRLATVAGVTLAMLAAALGGWAMRSAPVSVPMVRQLRLNLGAPPDADVVFTTTGGGSVISQDGRSVAFVAVRAGATRLWVRALDSGTARELPGTDGARMPFWSPDSQSIGFFAEGSLKTVPAAGGQPIVVAPAIEPRGGAWGASDTIVFAPSSEGPLSRVDARGGTPVRFTTLDEDAQSHRWPQFLPDGQTILFWALGERGRVLTTRVDRTDAARALIVAESNATFFAREGSTTGHLLWVMNGGLVAQQYDPTSATVSGTPVAVPGLDEVMSLSGTGRSSVSVSRDGTLLFAVRSARSQLMWSDAAGRQGAPVGSVGEFAGLRLSPDGHEALVTSRSVEGGNLWRIDLESGSRSRVTDPARGWYAVWSPDGEQVAFTSQNSVRIEATSARGVGAPRTLVELGRRAFPSDWSHAAAALLYTIFGTSTSYDVWLLPSTPGEAPRPLLNTAFSELHGQLSPDGRWMAFTSNEAGRDDVYVQDYPTPKAKRLLSPAGGSYPRWSPDGRRLFYLATDRMLRAMPVRATGPVREEDVALMRVVEPPAMMLYPYDVAPDGRILSLTRPRGEGEGALTVLTNWDVTLPR